MSDAVDDVYLSLLSGTSYHVGYIPSASDRSRRYFAKVQDQYKSLGITRVTYFDLGDEYNEASIVQIFDCDAIHLSGGDPFPFLAMVRNRKFSERLRKYVQNGGLLVGVSAGAMILTRSLGLAVEPLEIGHLSKPAAGLRMLDFEFYPHFKESQKASKALQAYARSQKTTVYACDDDAGILITHGQTKLLGHVFQYR